MMNTGDGIICTKIPIVFRLYFIAIIFTLSVISEMILLNIIFPAYVFPNQVRVTVIVMIFTGLGFIYWIQWRPVHRIKTLVNQKYPLDLDEYHQIHDAFIIIHSFDLCSLGSPNLNNLINGFIKRKYPFKIYHCYNPQEFKNILRNENAKYIWIFGHGWRGGVAWKWRKSLQDIKSCEKKKSEFPYIQLVNEIEDYPKKEFIAQFHCNPKKYGDKRDTPLVALLLSRPLSASKYFISDGLMYNLSIWYFTREILKVMPSREERE